MSRNLTNLPLAGHAKFSKPTTMQPSDILAKIIEGVTTTFNRNWAGVREILEEDEEITVPFKITITNRDTEPGQQADKSQRVRVTMGYAKRHTDSVEYSLSDPDQGELPLNGPAHDPQPFIDQFGDEVPEGVNVSSPGAEEAGTTSVGDVLDAAASVNEAPKVDIDLDEPGWTPGGLLTKFRVQAKAAGWKKPQTSVIVDLIKSAGTDLDAIKAILRNHVTGVNDPTAL